MYGGNIEDAWVSSLDIPKMIDRWQAELSSSWRMAPVRENGYKFWCKQSSLSFRVAKL